MTTIPFHHPLTPATFVARPNRFLVRCTLDDSGEAAEAHLADRGRLETILVPGRRLWLEPASSPTRRTRWTVRLAETPTGDGLVSLDSVLPNRLVRRALERGALDEFRGWSLLRAEWSHGDSRFDFLLGNEDGERLALEVKSVALAEDGVGLFPDAPTTRGTRHLHELAALARHDRGHAAVLFVAQRGDVDHIRPAAHIDPAFARALADARAAGVRLLARRCHVALTGITLGNTVEIRTTPRPR